MDDVYSRLARLCTDERPLVKWVWTASQTKARRPSQKTYTVEDAADSINKGRRTSFCLYVERDKSTGLIDFSVEKGRFETADVIQGQRLGEHNSDFARGRLVEEEDITGFFPLDTET